MRVSEWDGYEYVAILSSEEMAHEIGISVEAFDAYFRHFGQDDVETGYFRDYNYITWN
jgi:hypothetical protein